MKQVPLFTLAMALVATSAWAATDDQHAVHHPAAGTSAPAAKAMPGKANPSMAHGCANEGHARHARQDDGGHHPGRAQCPDG